MLLIYEDKNQKINNLKEAKDILRRKFRKNAKNSNEQIAKVTYEDVEIKILKNGKFYIKNEFKNQDPKKIKEKIQNSKSNKEELYAIIGLGIKNEKLEEYMEISLDRKNLIQKDIVFGNEKATSLQDLLKVKGVENTHLYKYEEIEYNKLNKKYQELRTQLFLKERIDALDYRVIDVIKNIEEKETYFKINEYRKEKPKQIVKKIFLSMLRKDPLLCNEEVKSYKKVIEKVFK